MRRSRSQPPFMFVGNQPCLDFINTEMIIRGQRTDLLVEWRDLIVWMVRAKLMSAGGGRAAVSRLGRAGGERLLAEAKTLRTVLREMAERVVAGRPVPQSAVETINGLLSRRPGYVQLVRANGRFERRFDSETSDAAQVLAPLAEAACELLCDGDLSLVRKCRNASCILYFYDTTKNHARQWCSMGLCGNRVKVAAHYRRHRNGG